jgi:hypothetical protein
MISSDILVLGMAAIAGSMAIILTIFAVRMYRNEGKAEGSSVEEEVGQGGEGAVESEVDADMESRGAEELRRPKAPAVPLTETPDEPDWEPQPVAEPMSNTVATILRNPETGQVILQVGGRPYVSAQALKGSSSWPEVESALSHLLGWLSETDQTETYMEGLSDEEENAEPVSMIDEINEILSDMAKEARGKLRGVRLVEGTGGLVRVLVGIESYDLDEVPDPEVRRLIREAVQEWESRR